jgi:hypothetical protein
VVYWFHLLTAGETVHDAENDMERAERIWKEAHVILEGLVRDHCSAVLSKDTARAGELALQVSAQALECSRLSRNLDWVRRYSVKGGPQRP